MVHNNKKKLCFFLILRLFIFLFFCTQLKAPLKNNIFNSPAQSHSTAYKKREQQQLQRLQYIIRFEQTEKKGSTKNRFDKWTQITGYGIVASATDYPAVMRGGTYGVWTAFSSFVDGFVVYFFDSIFE